jgi:hypothetical protein
MELRRFIKTTIREYLNEMFDKESSFKRNVYGNNEDYREMTDNKVIIWNSDYKVGFQYIFDHKELPDYTFIHLYPYSENYNYIWNDELSNNVKSKLFIDAIRKLPKVVKEYSKKFGKIKKIVFRPKTIQMGNIYTSTSFMSFLNNNFGSDYVIKPITAETDLDKNYIPVGSVIMELK